MTYFGFNYMLMMAFHVKVPDAVLGKVISIYHTQVVIFSFLSLRNPGQRHSHQIIKDPGKKAP